MATNNAINNSQLTTNGQLLIGSTGATPVVSTITAGSNITVTNGAGSISIAATAGAAGALTWIASATASNSATIDFANNLSSTYDNYLILCENVVPSTAGAFFGLQIGTGATPTYQTTAYSGVIHIGNQGSASSNASATTYMQLDAITGLSATSTVGASGQVVLSNVNNASNYKNIVAQLAGVVNGGTYPWIGNISNQWAGATVLTSLRFLMSSGNISSGVFKLYGYQN